MSNDEVYCLMKFVSSPSCCGNNYLLGLVSGGNPQHGGCVLQPSLEHNLVIKLLMSFLTEGIVMSISVQEHQKYMNKAEQH